MRIERIFKCLCEIILLPLLLCMGFSQTGEQQETSTPRGLFLSSRPGKTPATTQRPTKKPPHVTPKKRTPLGLGYTIYLKKGDSAERVSQDHVFHSGDKIKLVFESNTDGYLYIFHQEVVAKPDGKVTMLFPDCRLAEGTNKITKHVLYEVPSSAEANPLNRWLVFEGPSAMEQLTVVLSRSPLAGVPIETELINYCRNQPEHWSLPIKDFRAMTQKAERVLCDGIQDAGTKLTKSEEDSIVAGCRSLRLSDCAPPTRQLGLPSAKQGEPGPLKYQDAQPSVVHVNHSATSDRLMVLFNLIHQ